MCNSAWWLGIPYDEAWALCSTVPAGIFDIELPEIDAPETMLPPYVPPANLHADLAADVHDPGVSQEKG